MSASNRAWIILAALMVVTAVVYWPSLHGGYLFDDAIYFVDNQDIHVTTMSLGEWINAAFSQSGINLLARPLSALSFAANYYFTGLDPFWPKVTNVVIHLANGFLLFLLIRELFRLCDDVGEHDRSEHTIVAAALAGAWLLLPINLTGVAYVSQRMEALANLFVFLGLFWYLHARRIHYARANSGAMLWISVIVCTVCGLTTKEDAALLPLFTACIEFAITRFRDAHGRVCKAAVWMHVSLLVVPFVAGLIWLVPRMSHGVSDYRDFTIAERLLTEPRVIVHYIGWTLIPNLNSLTFYHDDLVASRGLLDPPATLASILALVGLFGAALWQRRTRPLFCLGILWFFAGHSMTGTVIPLELVFEHRNYFPSAGLLLAAASLLAIEPGISSRRAKLFVASGFIFFFAFTTFLRAEEWSNPIRLAFSETQKRPDSKRAQYELARTLIVAAGDDAQSPLIDESIHILERNAFLPDSGITGLQALIFINGRAHRRIDPRWWEAIIQKLQDRTPTQSDIGALIFLFHCQINGECPPQKEELFQAFTAALTRSNGNVNLISAYSDFAFRDLDDAELAERMARNAVEIRPNVPVFRANLIHLLIAVRRYDEAAAELEKLQSLNHFGSLDTLITGLNAQLSTSKSQIGPPAAPPVIQPINR